MGDVVHERALADIGEATEQERSGVGVDGREASEMLPDLFEILERGL